MQADANLLQKCSQAGQESYDDLLRDLANANNKSLETHKYIKTVA